MDAKLRRLLFKTIIFILSLSFAWWLIKSGSVQSLIENILPLRLVAEITAGVFYTSFLTAPVSLAMLVILAQHNNPVLTAILAGLGAALGDFLIVKFFREKISSEVKEFSKQLHLQKINSLLQKLHLDFLAPLLGAIIVASPLPDELGLMLLGVSKLSYRQIILISYILNTAGILLIVLPINLLS
ncbi:hypothetical protein HYU94_01160 [Candidatus Daviesbacteria bacterium]|nr:hypothetical protein [Candidatus Daviesbacteria bacterium]